MEVLFVYFDQNQIYWIIIYCVTDVDRERIHDNSFLTLAQQQVSLNNRFLFLTCTFVSME